MKIYPDYKLIKKITSSTSEERRLILQTCSKALGATQAPLQFVLGWPTLLEYLDFEPIFEHLPKPNRQDKIFDSIVEVLKMDSEKDVVIYLYDQIFVECLTEVKKLKQVQQKVLIDQIRFKREHTQFQEDEALFSSTLNYYETKLIKDPQDIMHNLILYLAWDRVCVYLSILFNESDLKLKNGLVTLRECLIESFQHITENGKTIPGLYRFVETLYAYMMKEENLDKYTESEWAILSKSPMALSSLDDLPQASYIDTGLSYGKQLDPFVLKFLTLDTPDKVKARISLTELILDHLQKESNGWEYVLRPCVIACLKEENDGCLAINTIVNSQDCLEN